MMEARLRVLLQMHTLAFCSNYCRKTYASIALLHLLLLLFHP